jgi:hypothetical protein
VKGVPLSYYDALIRALLILLPHELPDSPKSPFGWEFMARKIQGSFKNQDTIDVVVFRAIVILESHCRSSYFRCA